jgi:hypothetical protein
LEITNWPFIFAKITMNATKRDDPPEPNILLPDYS